MDWCNKQTNVHTNDTRGRVSVHRNLFRARFEQPYNYPKRDRSNKRNRHYKYLLPVILIGFFPSQSFAETVGGVSATASPIANSSGSVTNQAVQVLQGPYITNTYGGGIQCQGPTRNFTPFVTGNISASKPYEDYYDSPVYDMSDNVGAFDDEGNPIGDGVLDNPGSVQFYDPVRTGQKDNYNLSVGFSMTWSTPTDKKLQDQCKEAAATQIALQQQLTANKRLDFEIARLKNCGELMQRGIYFKPGTEMAKICADVMVQGVNVIKPHTHSIPQVRPITSSSSTVMPELQHSSDAAHLGGPVQIRPSRSFP